MPLKSGEGGNAFGELGAVCESEALATAEPGEQSGAAKPTMAASSTTHEHE